MPETFERASVANRDNQRDSNLELYRIIVMLLIVAHHFVVNSGLTAAGGPIPGSDPLSWRTIFLNIFGAWGKTGINCFVLITGYYMCKSEISLKKYLKLILEIYFYRITIFLIFTLSGYEPLTAETLKSAILPVRSVSNGFTSCFILFYLFIPFLNVLVRNMTEKQHQLLVLLIFCIYSVLGTVPGITVTFNYVTWFCCLFIYSSYISLFPKKVFKKTALWGWLSLGIFIISCITIVVIPVLKTKSGRGFSGQYFFVADSNKLLALALGVSLFLFFKNLKIKYNPLINSISATTFGVLLIHANSDAMRRWLWKDVLDVVGHYNSRYLVLYAIGSVLAVFAACSAIDMIRIRFIEKPMLEFLEKKLKNEGR